MKNKKITFILESFKPFKFWIIGQLVVSLIVAIDLSLRPYLVKVILDKLVDQPSTTLLSALEGPIILYITLSFLIVVIWRFYDYCWLKFNPPLKCHLGSVLMERMMLHSLNTTNNHFSGALANRIKDVMSGVPDLLKFGADRFLTQALMVAIAIFTISKINYKFSVALSIWIIIFLIVAFWAGPKISRISNNASKIRSTVVGKMVDILTNISNVRFFSTHSSEKKYLEPSLQDYIKADQARDWFFLKLFSFQGVSFVIYQALTFYWLIDGYKHNVITPGDFALILGINISIIDRMWNISRDIGLFSDLLGNISQGLSIVLSDVEIKDEVYAKDIKVENGVIEFKNVCFHYPDAQDLFSDFSLKIEAGQKIGIVGFSGSGKSSFLNLLLRFYDISSGEITIDGHSIKEFTQQSLRNNMGVIPQEPSLFNRTILENIRYGAPFASDTDVVEAAKKAHAHDFIINIVTSYNYIVGERGVKLSGGQKQRIAIARAILKNAPILILDEATSQLDSGVESKIQDSLKIIMEGKTAIVIAHRLSTLLQMDRIVVFDQGKIVEDGTHEELLRCNGIYKHLWDHQVGGFILNKKTKPHVAVGHK